MPLSVPPASADAQPKAAVAPRGHHERQLQKTRAERASAAARQQRQEHAAAGNPISPDRPDRLMVVHPRWRGEPQWTLWLGEH